MDDAIRPGAPAPSFTGTTVQTERELTLSTFAGVPLLLIFIPPAAAREVRDVVIGVRRQYPDHDRLAIVIIIDLATVPRLLRGMVNGMMESAWATAAADVPAAYDPDEHLQLIPDWEGAITRRYGVNGTTTLVMIDGQGLVLDRYTGTNVVQAAPAFVRPFVDRS